MRGHEAGKGRQQRRLGTGAITLLLLAACCPPAAALLEWTIYTDPSELRSISLSDGAVWAAGRGGLVRLDLDDQATLCITTADGLPSCDLNAVLAQSDDEIWVGTAGEGLMRYRPGDAQPWWRWQVYQGIASDHLYCLLLGPDGRLWYGSDGGFGVMEGDVPGDIWTFWDGLLSEEVRSLAFVADTLFAGTDDGLHRLAPDGILEFVAGGPAGHVDALVVAADSLWLIADGAIMRRAATGEQWLTLALPEAGYEAQALAAAGDLLTVVLGAAGDPDAALDLVYRYEPATGSWSDLSAGLPEYQYYNFRPDYTALAMSTEGATWLGGVIYNGTGPGLLQHDGEAWEHFSLAEHPLGPDLMAFRLFPSGRLWTVGTAGGGFLEDGAWQREYPRSELGGHPHFAIDVLEDNEGWVWFVAWGGAVARYHLPSGEEEIVFAWRHIVRCAEDAGGNRWFLSDRWDTAGIDIYDNQGAWHVLDPANGNLPGNELDGIAFLSDERVALLFRGAGLQIWDTNATLFDFSDDDWYAASGDDQPGVIVDVQDLLPDDTQGFSVSADAEGGLWLGQSNGLVRVVSAGDRYRVLGKLGKKTFGSPGLFTPQVGDVAAAPDGSVWVGTPLGLSHVHYDRENSAWLVENWTNESGREEAGEDLFPREVLSPLPQQEVKHVELSADGQTVFVGTLNGIARIDLLPDPLPPAEAIQGAWLYPNPARLNLGHDAVRLGGVESPVEVTVYNLEGQLVANPKIVAPGEVLWDLRTRFGNLAVSGVYILRLEDRGRLALRKLVLVR